MAEELNQVKQALVRVIEDGELLQVKYSKIKALYWQLKDKYNATKKDIQYGFQLGEGSNLMINVFSTVIYTSKYRELWSASQQVTVSGIQQKETNDKAETNSLLYLTEPVHNSQPSQRSRVHLSARL